MFNVSFFFLILKSVKEKYQNDDTLSKGNTQVLLSYFLSFNGSITKSNFIRTQKHANITPLFKHSHKK